MVFKIVALLAVIFLVYILFFRKNRVGNRKDDKYEGIADTMVECPKCKTYIAKDDAILSNGRYFCSKECLK